MSEKDCRRAILKGRQPTRSSGVLITHVPTGAQGYADCHRSQHQNEREARSLCLARAAAVLAGMPLPDEIGRIRSFHLAPQLGIPPFVRDDRTGHQFDDPLSILNGDLDALLRDAIKDMT